MRKTETLFVGAGLIAALIVSGVVVWRAFAPADNGVLHQYPTTKYGAFLAAQHAIYVNDFERAAEFGRNLDNIEYAVVYNTRMLSEFLSGRLPSEAKLMRDEKNAAARLIYDAYLVDQGQWEELYKRHKKDTSALSAPLRIWSSVATKHSSDAIKFISKLPTNESWKSFARGQIYAQEGDIAAAEKEFAAVSPDFMNINDYLYVMSFYRANDLNGAAAKLREEFTSKPGGMYMLGYDSVPDWSVYEGNKNALAFSLLQSVSHTQIMMYSDLALLLLRFAQITGSDFASNNDAINYYLGQYFHNNVGDYIKHFNAISPDSPFYLFGVLRIADKTGDFDSLAAALEVSPLFVPGANRLIAHYVSHGDRRGAMRVVARALADDNITPEGRGYFLKSRAQINFAFGDLDAAQSDIRAASDVLPIDGEILALQSKIWALQRRELDNAYEYAMGLVRQNPTDVGAWDVLGRVVAVREGDDAALELIERVGEVSNSCSSLFEQLGDLYSAKGDSRRARDAYSRAIDLAQDGLTVIPALEKKIRNLK
ncbi:MAG: hypothetical protein K2I81_00850 [Alphaproteobacteria bacterium]|nr:hypothetical protein [Alphaproteobacteria bacterium]